MAPKKRLPSPSLEDEKPSTQKQPEDKVVHEEEDDSSEGEEGSSSEGSSSEGSSSEDSSEVKDQSQPASKNPPPSSPIPNPKPASQSETESESESGSDSESETDSQPEPTAPSKPTDSQPEPTAPSNPKVVKPLASKPMKSEIQAQTTAGSGTKRAAENGTDSNRSKKKTTAVSVTTAGGSDDENETEEDVKLIGEDSKKRSQRIFSDEDELAILKGLADFISKTKKDPMKDRSEFYSFVKKSLRAEATHRQLWRRVNTLKKKYETGDSFTKPHDKKAFELYKKVWGNIGANEVEENENGKVNGKIAKGVKKEATGSIKKELAATGSVKKELAISPKKEATGSVKKELAISTKKEDVKVESVVDNSLILSEMYRIAADAGGLSVFNKDAMERGLELIEESKRLEFEERWKQMRLIEMELAVRRAQLVKDQSNSSLQALMK